MTDDVKPCDLCCADCPSCGRDLRPTIKQDLQVQSQSAEGLEGLARYSVGQHASGALVHIANPNGDHYLVADVSSLVQQRDATIAELQVKFEDERLAWKNRGRAIILFDLELIQRIAELERLRAVIVKSLELQRQVDSISEHCDKRLCESITLLDDNLAKAVE